MLHKTISIMIALALSTLLFPAGAGEEREEQEYESALSVREGVTGQNLGIGLILFPNPEGGCHYGCTVRPLGGVFLWPDLPYEHVDLHIDDAVFAQPASEVCFYNPEGDLRCDEDDYALGTDCGARSAHDVPIVAEQVAVFLYSVYIAPSLDVCLTSTGTVRATFY